VFIVLAAVVHDAWSQEGWVRGFVESFNAWLKSPHTSLSSWRPLAPPFGEVVAGCTFLLLGAWSSLLTLRATRLEGNRLALAGLSAILSVASAGLVGTFLVTFGWIRVSGLLYITGAMAMLLCVLTYWSDGPRELLQSYRRVATERTPVRGPGAVRRSIGEWGTRLVVGAVVLLVGVRDLISPVVEWDATVYHAELARLWFLERPSPPLLFGPSLGVEISANYPPLFPASGLVANLSAGRVTDVGLRLASPFIFAGLLLFVFAFTQTRFGRRSAWWTLLLLGTTPLIVLYSSWSTSYLLTTALGFAGVVACVEACESESFRWRPWIVSGVFLGLAILSSFYGWLFVVAGVLAVVLGQSGWSNRWRSVIAYGGAALAISSIWLLRNWIELGDPLYPLHLPFFHARGLTGPLWRAAQSELRTNANSYWIGSHSFLRLRQLGTLLFDRHLIAVGSLPAVVFCWMNRRRGRGPLLVGLTALFILGVELIPGWFWLRSLLLAVPFLAVAGGTVLARLVETSRGRTFDDVDAVWRSRKDRTAFRSVLVVLLTSLSVVSTTIAIAIAVSGPGQSTWTTQLPNGTNFAELDQSLGSTSSTLWTVFGGDYEAWVWLNRHLGHRRLATFDIRTYYLNDPESIFYLDGEEAKPLLRMTSPTSIERFFVARGVKYIFVPAWAVGDTATRDPSVNLLPLHKFLGTSQFPLVASFAPSANFPLSNVYQIGGTVTHVAAALFPSAGSPSPAAGGPYDFVPRSTGGWIFVPVRRGVHQVLRIQYFGSSRGRVSFSAYVTGGAWDIDFASIHIRPSKRWSFASFPVPFSSNGVVALSVGVGGANFVVKSAEVSAQGS